MKLTNAMKLNAEKSLRSLSDKASEAASGMSPLDIYEYEQDGQTLYICKGVIDAEGWTFDKLQAYLEDLADMD